MNELAFAGMVGIVIIAIGGCAAYLIACAMEDLADVASKATSALAQVKGLSPHAADPETFSPAGRSWDAVEHERIEVVSNVRAAAKERRMRELSDAIRALEMRGDKNRVAELRAELDRMEKAG